MVSFSISKFALASMLASMATSSDAAYRMYHRHPRHSMSLGARMLPTISRSSFYPRDFGRVMYDFDEILDNVLGDFEHMFYEPLPMKRLLGNAKLNLLPGKFGTSSLALRNGRKPYEITQDDNKFQIVVSVPGVSASDINLQLEQEGRLLRITGESKREEEGIFVKSTFDKSFGLDRNIDTDNISASMENGVLTITAPKKIEAKENFRRIDIVEHKAKETNVEETTDNVAKAKETPEVAAKKDDSIIDLDVETKE